MSQMRQWFSWKVPEAFVWNTLKSTSPSHYHWMYQFMYATMSWSSQGGAISWWEESVDFSSQSCITTHSALVSSTRLEPMTAYVLLSDSCSFVDMGCPLWREDGSVVYNCCWTSPAHSGVWSRSTHDHVLLLQIWDSYLDSQAPVFISPKNRVMQLTPQALGPLFVASYNSQGYIGGIRPASTPGDREHLDFEHLLHAWLIFDPKDGGNTFLRNVCSYTDYIALYGRRWQHSQIFLTLQLQLVCDIHASFWYPSLCGNGRCIISAESPLWCTVSVAHGMINIHMFLTVLCSCSWQLTKPFNRIVLNISDCPKYSWHLFLMNM
jgi:hypothetical protein